MHNGLVAIRNADSGVVDDDALQGLAGGEDTSRLVILSLFTHEKKTNLSIVDHELDLLFRAGSIKRDGDGTDAPGAEVGKEILHTILRKHTDVFLHAHTHIQQSIGHQLYFL